MAIDTPERSILDPVTRAMSDAVLAISSERSLEGILQTIIDAGRELAGARYAALGVPDGEGGFARFIVSGMSDELVAAIGPLPRAHGMLGAILDDDASYRVPDVRRDPRFGGWPSAHPAMRSFLGVPIRRGGKAIGAFYLTDRVGAAEFSPADQELIELLAPHAAVAIHNAELLARVRELVVVEERNRLARELHDSVSQTLFSMTFTAEAVADLAARDPERAREEAERLRRDARAALAELRALIFELRPPALDEGLVAALRKQAAVLARVYRQTVEVRGDEPELDETAARELYRIAQEALANAVRHASAARVDVLVDAGPGRVTITVADDGVGFDPSAPAVRSRHLGLTSMEERARVVGADLAIESAPGAGTNVRVVLPGQTAGERDG